MHVKPTNSRSHRQRRIQITSDGKGIANQVGSAALRELDIRYPVGFDLAKAVREGGSGHAQRAAAGPPFLEGRDGTGAGPETAVESWHHRYKAAMHAHAAARITVSFG
ncbi:MAG TPA: hypothetical protein VMU49_09810 [Candidatus Acidoferrales bacterium]|nr:hypothetical protein [Candidatus Acidoferrales bacterium]